MNADQWEQIVTRADRTWYKQPLPAATAVEWFGRLHVFDADVVDRAMLRLEKREPWWPSLSEIAAECREIDRGAPNPVQEPTGVSLREWLDRGAPGYPDGEQAARSTLARLAALRRAPRLTPDDSMVHGAQNR